MAVYDVIGRPPSLAGGLNVIVAELSPAVVDTTRGGFGTKIVVIGLEGPDSALLPIALVAWTVNL